MSSSFSAYVTPSEAVAPDGWTRLGFTDRHLYDALDAIDWSGTVYVLTDVEAIGATYRGIISVTISVFAKEGPVATYCIPVHPERMDPTHTFWDMPERVDVKNKLISDGTTLEAAAIVIRSLLDEVYKRSEGPQLIFATDNASYDYGRMVDTLLVQEHPGVRGERTLPSVHSLKVEWPMDEFNYALVARVLCMRDHPDAGMTIDGSTNKALLALGYKGPDSSDSHAPWDDQHVLVDRCRFVLGKI